MKRALEQAAANPPKFETHPIRNFFADWSRAAQRYGEGASPAGEFISPLSRARQDAAGTRFEDFDEHVMRSAPKAILQLPSPKPGEAGIHPDGLRSEWAFEERVVYKKKLTEIHLKNDWWYFAAATPMALLTGNFEETTGDVWVVDLHDPKYTCTVRLLRVW